ncbi:D-alanyl-D-alanine carboxypeptidase [Candidatus Woesebacteria bacterium]|nr:D-alanyl-D-alanine carboxypeptidase [Candidatus Woesebacteria bacterium]
MNFLKSNLLYLAMLAFVLAATTAVSFNIKSPQTADETPSVLVQKKYFPARPILPNGVKTFPVLSGQAILALDLDSGVTLYKKNPDFQVLPASTTKIITALVAMDYYDPESELVVSNEPIDGQKMGLIQGEKIKVRDLLYGLLVYSANDAAEVLAKNYCAPRSLGEVGLCGRDSFVSVMNKKAQELGLRNTKFINPSGLDGNFHYSTARDLAIVSAEAMENPFFAQIVSTKQITVKSTDQKIVHKLTNINELLGKVDGVLGVKTGWTENARENLVTYIERDGKKVIIALLGSQDRFGETEELVNWIFENYQWETVVYELGKLSY